VGVSGVDLILSLRREGDGLAQRRRGTESGVAVSTPAVNPTFCLVDSFAEMLRKIRRPPLPPTLPWSIAFKAEVIPV